ncbi:MAG TPA: SMC-Scp complex subunit ScpB [Candidatus Acidoferrales bacterium]|nr:SMC-Scp complex subunit ScpB [Candidatus Acidoferrales bacterium]
MSEPQIVEKQVPASQPTNRVAMIEAALYVAGKPLEIKTLAVVVGLRSEDKVKELARSLKSKYGSEGSCLEVLELSDGRFVMQLKPQYVQHVKRLATRQLLTPGPMKTLSFIAYRQPVTQSYLAKVRGNLAYSHVKQLREVGLIAEERLGRTKVLRTTPNFADYFNLSHETPAMKKQLEQIFDHIKTSKGVKESSSVPTPSAEVGGSAQNA